MNMTTEATNEATIDTQDQPNIIDMNDTELLEIAHPMWDDLTASLRAIFPMISYCV